MGECTSKEWGRGKKKIVKKKLTRAEVEALIPGRHGMTASEAAGATDVIMAAMEDVSTSWEVHDDGEDDDKDDHHGEQSMATKAEQVKQQDTQHNLEEVVENAPSASVGNAQLDKEKHDHPITAASSSQHSESLIESFEYVQHSDACLSNKEIEIKPHTLLSEYLAAQQTFEKLSSNAPQAPEHRDKDIIAMVHSTGLLESVNKRIQDLLQLQLQSDTQVFKEQDMSESERDQIKDSLTIGGSTQQMSESYIVNLQKALQLIRLKEATETEHEIGPEDSFAPETVNSSECCGTSKICTMQETEGTDTISNLKQKFLTEAKLASLENLTVAGNSELQEKLMNANIQHQEQIKEVESMSNPGESDSHADAKAENSISIEEKDISPVTTEDTFNKETTPIASSKTNDRKINQNMEYLPHLEHSQGTVQPEIPEAYETSPGHIIREVQVQEHTQTMTDSGVVQHANVQAEPLVSYRPNIILSKDLTQDGAVSHLDLKYQEQKDADKCNKVAEDIINPTETLDLHQIDSVLGKELVDKTALTQVDFSHEQDTNIKTLVEQISEDPNGKHNAKLTKTLEGIDATTEQECGAKIDSISPFTGQIETTYIKRPIETENGNKTTEVSEGELTCLSQQELAAEITKTNKGNNIDSKNTKQPSINIALDSVNTKSNASLQSHMEEEAECMYIKEATSIETMPFPEDAIKFEEDKIENDSNPKGRRLEIAESSKALSQALPVIASIIPNEEKLTDSPSIVRTQSNEGLVISNAQNGVMLEQDSTSEELHNMIQTSDHREVQVTQSIYKTDAGIKEDQEVDTKITPETYNELKLSENTTNLVEQNEVSLNETQSSVHNDFALALAITHVENDGGQKEPGTFSKLDCSIAIVDREQKQTEILIGDVKEEKHQEKTQQQPHPADHMEALEIAQTLSLDQDSENSIVAVYDTLKLLPADDDESQQLEKKIIKESMLDVKNQLLVPEGSTTQEAQETFCTAPIPEDTTEVSTFEMSAMTDENTSKTIETRSSNVLQGMSNTASELVQQAHTAVTAAVEMNIGNETCNAKNELELQGVKEDSRIVKEKDEVETFRSEEKKLNEESLPKAPMFSSIESCEASKSSLLIEFPSKEESVAMLQYQTEEEAHPKELAKELTLHTRSNAEAEVMVEASSSTEEATEVTIHKTDFPVLTDQEETIRSPTETTVQVIQPTGVNSTSGINKTDMGDKTENLISNLEFQIAEHMLISQEGKDKEINQIKYINKDDGDRKQALKFEIAASQNVDTPVNANKLSSNEKQSFHVPEVNEPMPAQEENAACIQNSISISQDRAIVSDNLTSDEIDKIAQASVTENFESPNKKLNCETDIDSVEEVLQIIKATTDNELQEINESTTQPIQHCESTVNDNSSVCDMITITDGATTVECTDGEEINESSPRFELPIHSDKEDCYVEKKTGGTEECQVQQEKLYEDTILEGTKLEPAASSEKVLETFDHCIRQELQDAIKIVQTRPEEEESIKSHIQENDDQSEHSTSDKIQNDSTKEMFPPATGNESQGRSGSATYMVQDNEPNATLYLANHHDATAITHNVETAESTSEHKESERPFLEQQMIHDKVLEQASQLLPPDLAQSLEIVYKASLDEETYGQVPSAQEISEIVPPEGSQHQEESTVVVNVAAGSEKETAKTPESPRDLCLSVDEEETPSLHETNKFNLLVPITEVEVSKAVSTFDTGAIADEDNCLVLEKRNDDLPGTNTAHSLVQQEEATLNAQMSSMDESVVANVAAGSEKETAKTPESPRDLKFSFDKEEADCSMHETNKSNLLVPITEVEVSHAVSALDTVAITDKDTSPLIDAGGINLPKIFDNSLAPVQHTEATLHEQMSSSEDPTAMTYVAAGIEKKTVSETPESTKDVFPSLEKEGSSSSHENDKSNLVIPIPQVQELEAVSAFDTGAVTNEESICHSVTETENNDLQDTINNAPALVQQGEATLNKKISSTEDSVIVTNVVTGIDKETACKIPESTRGLNSSFEKEDASSSYTKDESNLMVQILEAKSSEEASTFDTGTMTKNNGPPVIESGNDDIVQMNNAGTSLFQQDEAILHVQMSSGEDSVAASHVSAVLIPEVEELEAVSTFNPGATTGYSYTAIDTGNNDLLEIPITVPVLVRQTEATQHEQMSCTKDSLVVTHAVTGIVKEGADKTTESSRDLKLSFDEEETSSSLETDEYNLTIPNPEVEASEAISAFDTDTMTDKDSSLVIERDYNDLQGAHETVPTLFQQVEGTLHEKMLSIDDAVIMDHFAAGIEEATESDTPKQARDIKFSFNEEEAASSHETDKSNLMVQIQDAEASGETSAFYAGAITEKNNSPVIELGNYDPQGITNTTTVLAQQAELASQQKMSFEEEAIVVTHVSARIEKEVSGDTLESTRGLQLQLEEEDASSSHETDEFELVSLPEDTTPGAVSTFDIGEGADKDSSPVMETGNKKLLVMTNTVDELVVQSEAVQNEQKTPIDDSAVVTQVASGTEEETASKTLESIGDIQISFEEKETPNSYDIDISHIPVPIPQLAEFTVPAVDTGATADEKNSPIIETRNDDSQGLTADLLVLNNNIPCPDHHTEASLHQKMSSTEDPVVQTNVSAGMEKETASETPESTTDLPLPFKEEESLCEIDKSNLRIIITEVEASEAASDFDKVAITEKNIFPVIESENKDLLGMIHTKTDPVQQDGDTLLEQMSYGEDSKVVKQVSAGLVKETSSETLQSTKDLQLPIEEKEASSLHGNEKSSLMVQIPEVEEEDASSSHETDKSNLIVPTLEVEEEDASSSSETDKSNLIIPTPEDVSTFDMGADAAEYDCQVMERMNNKLGGDSNTVAALVPQAEAILNEQMSSTDNSVVVTQVATGVQKETASETPKSIGDLQHSFEEEEDSNSYAIDKSNLAVPILEVDATEPVSTIVTDAMTDKENSPVKQTRKDDSLGLTDNLLVLTNIKPALVQQTEDIINEQILSIKDSLAKQNNAARLEKETVSETTEATGDLKVSFKEEESLREIDKSDIRVPIPEVEESEAAPAFEIDAVTDKIIIPAIKSENNDLLGMTNIKTALVQQDGGSLPEQMSCVQDSMVMTQVSAGIGKETSSESLESTRDLLLSAEEKEASCLHESDKSSQMFKIPEAEEEDASSSYETDKSEFMVPVPEDTSEAISTFDIGSEADKNGSTTMETESNKLQRVTNTVPALVAQAEVTLNEENLAIDNLMVGTQVTTGVEEGTANEITQSMGDLQLPFQAEESSNFYDIDKSNLTVPIPEVKATEAVSAFDTGDVTHEESSPAAETSSDHSSDLTNDLLVLTNIKPELVQQTEATLHEQISSTEVPVVETQDAAANEKETVREIPESTGDLQPSFGEKECLCEIHKSNITVPFSEVEESEATTATDVMTDGIIIPVLQSENNDLPRVTNTETALVQQDGATLIEQMSCLEDSMVVTQVSAGIGKETSSETLESTNYLQLSAEEKESSSQIDKSNITVQFSQVAESEADQASDIDAVTDKIIAPVIQSENNNLLGMTNSKTALVQQDGAILLEQMSCVEDSMVLPQVSTGNGKETSSDTQESTKDLQLSLEETEASNLHDSNKSSQMFHIPDAEEKVSSSSQEIEKSELMFLIPEDTASEAVSTFDIGAEANQEDSLAMETGNKKLVGVTNTVPALAAQAEVTINDQAPSIDDSIVVTQIAAEIEERNPSESPQSMGDLQLSFEEKEVSNSYDDKSNLMVSITEVEETEAVSTFDTAAMTHKESSPVTETRNDDSLGLTSDLLVLSNTKSALVQQAEPTQHEQMSTIEESMVETHDATGTKKEIVGETPESTRDLKLSLEHEESLCEIDESNISVPNYKFEASEAAPAFEMIAVTDNIIIPVGQSDNNNLLEMSNTKTALVHQDQATILDEMSCLEDSMVGTEVSARIGKEISSETLESTKDLQLRVEEKEASSFPESDKSSQTFGTPEVDEEDSLSSQETEKSKLQVLIPEGTTSEAVSAYGIAVEAYHDGCPAMETGNNKLVGMITTVPVQVAQAEVTINAKTSSKDDSIVVAQAAGIDEETASETPQSMQDLLLSSDEEADPKPFDINKSNLVVPIPVAEETEVVSAFDTVAMTHEDSSPVILTRNDDSLRLTDDLLVLTNTEPVLVHQAEPIQHEKMSFIEELVVEMHDATGINKETMTEIPESTGDLKLSSEQEESLRKIDKSNITAPIPEVEALEAAPAFEMIAMTDNSIIPVGESENDDLLEMSNLKTALVHQDPATLLDQISCAEDSMVVTNVSPGIEKDTSSETPDSTRDLQLSLEEKEASSLYESDKSSQMVQIPEVEEEDNLSSYETDKSKLIVQIPEDTTTGAGSIIEIDAGIDHEESPSMETENNKLAGAINTVPALVAHTETTILNEQTLSIDESVVVTQVSAGIEEETASETPQSMENLQLSFAEEEASHSYHIGQSNVAVPIQEVEATEAVSAIETGAMTHEESSPVIEIRNNDTQRMTDDLLVLTNTEPALIQQGQSYIGESLVETHDATGTEKETVRKTPGSTGDLQLPFKQEEMLCEIVKSNITVPIPEVEASNANPAFEVIAVKDDIIIPVGESENNNLLEMTNPKTVPVHQDQATFLDQTSCVEDSMVVTNVSAGIGNDTSSETPDSTRDLQLSIEEKEASSLYESAKSSQMVQIPEVEEEDTLSSHETDKSELAVQIPNDTTLGSVSTIDIGAEAYQDRSPSMETGNNNLVGVINTVPTLVAQTESTTLNEQTSSIDDSVGAAQVAAGIEEETATETPQSMGNIQLSFAEEEPSLSYNNSKSNAAVPILEVEAAEAVSAIDTCVMNHEKSSPVIEIKNDDTRELTDDLPVLTNTDTALIQQAEATPHEQIPLIEESVVEAHDATGSEKETMRETPGSTRDLQLPFKQEERLCEIDKSDIAVPIPEVEASETASAFEVIAVKDDIIIPVGKSENNNLLEMTNPKTVPVHQDRATLLDQTSCVEDSVVVTNVSAGIGNDTSSETPDSTRDLQLSLEEKEASSLYESDKSSQMVQIPEVGDEDTLSSHETDKSELAVQIPNDTTLGSVSTIDIGAEAYQDKSPSMETENNNLLGVINTVPTLVAQTETTTLNEQTSPIDDSVGATQVAAGIEEETATETPQSMGNIQLSFAEEEPSLSNDNSKSNAPTLVAQTETTTLNEQTSPIDDSVGATQVAAGIEEETATETPQSMGNIQLSFAEEEPSLSNDNSKSNAGVPILEVETAEANSAIDTCVMNHEKSYPVIEIKNDDTRELTDDLLVLTNTDTALIQQAEATPHEQIPLIEESVVEEHDATGSEKETMRETPGSTRDLQLPFKQEERLCEIDKSDIAVPIPEVEASETASAFEVIAVKDDIIIPVGESENNNLLEMTDPKTVPVHQDRATLLDQTSCVEDSVVVTNVSAGIGNDTSSETPDSTRDLQLSIEEKEASSLYESAKSSQMVQIPEVEEEDTLSSHETDKSELAVQIPNDTTLGSVSTIDIGAEADQDKSPSMETENNNLVGVINTVPTLVAQTETTTINEQTSPIHDSVGATQVAAGIEEETATETPQSMGIIQLSFAEEEPSLSCDNSKSNAAVPILEVEAAEAVSAIDTCVMNHEKSSPVTEIKNDDTLELTDDLPVLTNTDTALIQQAEATPHEQIPSIEESVVETHDAKGSEKETMRETPGSTRDLQLPVKQEERLYEIDKSDIKVSIPEVGASEAASAFQMISVADKIIIPVDESENNNLLEMSNAKTAPVHQDKATLLDQISCVEDSMVATSVSAGIEKDTSSEIPNSTRDLQISVEEKEASRMYESDESSQIVQIPEVEEEDTLSSHETDKSELTVQNPEDTILEAVSTIDIAAGTDQDDSPATENENNKLVGVINTVPVLVAQSDATLNDKTPPSIDDSVVETQIVAGIEEEIVCETPQSMGKLELTFEEAETSHSYEVAKSNLEVSIPEVEATEAVSAFDTDARTHEEVSPIIEIRNDDALELTDDSQVLTNTETALIQQAEVTPHEQMLSIEKSWVETHDAAGTEEETVSKIPGSARDLQQTFEQEESLCEINKSNITVPLPEVLASEATPALETIAATENITIPVGESENNDLIKISNPETAPVHHDISTLLDQISCAEDSIVVTNVSAGIGKDTSSETPNSTSDLQLSVEEKKSSSLNESDKSGQMVQIPEVEEGDALSSHETDKSELIVQILEDTTLGVVSTIDTAAESDQNDSPVMENENNILVGMINAVPTFVTPTGATLNEQTSSIDDSIIKTQAAAEIEEETARETPQPMGNVQLPLDEGKTSHSYDIGKSNLEVPIPEVEATEAVSAFATVAMTREECSPVIKIRNDDTLELTDDLLVLTITDPALIQQAEAIPDEQMPSIEKSLVETHHATGNQKETVSETPGSTTDLQLPFKQEERLCEIDESNIIVPIPEVEALEPTPAFEIISVTDKTIIHVGDSENNDLPEMSNTKTALAHPDGATLLEKKSCVQDSMVVTHVSAGSGKDISSESPHSTKDLELSVEEKATSILHKSDKSGQTVQIPEYTTIEAESTFAMAAEVDQNSSPDMGTENNKSVEVTKTAPALVAQADANLNEPISSIDDSIVVTKAASGIEKETASETLQSMEDLQLLFEKKEASNSYDNDKSNLSFLIPEAGAAEAVSTLDTDAKTRKESSSVIETTNDNPLEMIDDRLVMTNIKPALVQQAEATLHKQMSSIEESVFETCDAAETEKETVTLNPDSTGNLQLSFEHEEGMCEIDKSSIAVPIAEIIPSEADPFEMVAVSDKINIPVIESKNNDLLEMTNMETALAQQDGTTLFKQTSCVEDSMVDTYISADIGKDDSSEIPESTRDLQLPVEEKEMSSLHESDKSSQKVQIQEVEEEHASSSSKLIVLIPEDTKLGAVSTFDIGAEADHDSSLAMETQNNKLVGVINTMPALVAQAKIPLNEQTSDIDDSIVVTKVASGIEEETARETPQSMQDSHLLFEENTVSSLYNIDKSNLLVLIPEAEATDAKTHEESSPVIETRNDDPLELIDDYLVLNNTEAALVQQTEATLQEQMSYIEEPVVETQIAAATEKETVTENPESAGDLQLSLKEEERLCEIDNSNITVIVPEVEASEAAPFEMVAVTDEITVPVIESRRNDLLEMNNTKTALVQQDGATPFEQMSFVDSMVVDYISAEIGKETTNEIPESTRDLHISIKDKEASSLHESGKSSLLVQIPDIEENDALSLHETDKSEPKVLIPEDATSGAISTFGIDIGSDQNSSPAMETENNKLVGVTNTVPSLVAQAEITLNEQTSSVDDSIAVAQVATAIEEETKTETPQSMGDIELSFKEEEATEPVSDFDTVVMTHVKSSPVIETRNDVSVGLPDDLLVLTNTEPALVQKDEATLHEQMLSIEDSLVDKHTATVAEKETENEIPESAEDLQLSVEEEEGLCEIDKSNITVAVPEVEATEAAPDFNMLAVPEINIVPVTELENNDILRMTNTETAPVQLNGASLLEQMSHADDPTVVTHVSAGIGKETSIEILESTQDLKLSFKEKEVPDLHEFDKSSLMVQIREVEDKDASSSHKTDKSDTIILIPDATTSGEVLTNMHAEADEDSSPVMETGNNTLLEMNNTVPTLVVQAESTQNEQTPSVDTPVVPTRVTEGIEKETACETSKSTEDLQLSFDEEVASNSYEIEKSNIAVPIPELESTEAISTIDTGVMKDEDSSIVTETRNDDSLGLTDNLLVFSNTVPALIQQAETTESTRNLQISFEDKEASSSRETDKSTLAVAIPDVETSEAISSFDTGTMTDEDTSPVMEIQFDEENLSQTVECPISAISQSLETSDKVSKPSLDEQLLDPTPDTHEPMQFQTKDKGWTQKNKSSIEEETILAQDSTLLSPILILREDINLRNDQEVLQSIQLEDLQRMSKTETQNEQHDDITLNENPSVQHDDTAMINDTVQTERKEVSVYIANSSDCTESSKIECKSSSPAE